MTYDRDTLITICEAAIAPETRWYNRDSAGAHEQLGGCWALLKAGCEFDILTAGICATDERTIWVEVFPHGFMTSEVGWEEGQDADSRTFYLPTQQRLDEANGKDWY